MESSTAVKQFLRKLKIHLPYDQVIPFLGIYLKECKPVNNKASCTAIFITALFTTAKLWKSPHTPQWIKKKLYIHTHGVLFNNKKH
jgi:hypothetical protein